LSRPPEGDGDSQQHTEHPAVAVWARRHGAAAVIVGRPVVFWCCTGGARVGSLPGGSRDACTSARGARASCTPAGTARATGPCGTSVSIARIVLRTAREPFDNDTLASLRHAIHRLAQRPFVAVRRHTIDAEPHIACRRTTVVRLAVRRGVHRALGARRALFRRGDDPGVVAMHDAAVEEASHMGNGLLAGIGAEVRCAMGRTAGERAVGSIDTAIAYVGGEPVDTCRDVIVVQARVDGPLCWALRVDASHAERVGCAGGAVDGAVTDATIGGVDLGSLAVGLAAFAAGGADRVVEVVANANPIVDDFDQLRGFVGGLSAAALLNQTRLVRPDPSRKEDDVVMVLVSVLTAVVEGVAGLEIVGVDLEGNGGVIGRESRGAGSRWRQSPRPGDQAAAVRTVGIPKGIVGPVAGVSADAVVRMIGRHAIEQADIDPFHGTRNHFCAAERMRMRCEGHQQTKCRSACKSSDVVRHARTSPATAS